MNQGQGNFAPPVSYAINGGGFDVVSGDFNRDGHPDLAVIDANASVSLILNQGDGTFGPPERFYPGPYADTLAVGDFNRDGALDIVVGTSFSLNVMINQGNATFATAVTYSNVATCDYPGRLAVADINDDGYPDIARSCYQAGAAVAVRINQGDGTFGPETTYASGSWPWGRGLC
jgi:hypothetical protein